MPLIMTNILSYLKDMGTPIFSLEHISHVAFNADGRTLHLFRSPKDLCTTDSASPALGLEEVAADLRSALTELHFITTPLGSQDMIEDAFIHTIDPYREIFKIYDASSGEIVITPQTTTLDGHSTRDLLELYRLNLDFHKTLNP